MKPFELTKRPRRNRRTQAMRELVRETHVAPQDLVWPVFLVDGTGLTQPIESMPGVSRFSLDRLIPQIKTAQSLGIRGIALFPALPDSKKDKLATESANPDGLVPRAIRKIKETFPDLLIISDVAMDPYSSDGHDGVVKDGRVLNDESLEILSKMAIIQAKAGADIVAPSDMMDGRVRHIRQTLDGGGFSEVAILSYTAKYASAFYGPFRQALDSAPRFGDKKSYQMDPANRREALRELKLDIEEGADIVMVKPAMPYLDIISLFRENAPIPIAAYQVSGEYAMIVSATEAGRLDRNAVIMESLLAIKRAGADCIFTYFACEAAKLLQSS